MMKKTIMMIFMAGISISALAMESEEELCAQLGKAIDARRDSLVQVKKLILENKADVNCYIDKRNNTALMMAANRNRYEICKFLIENGANIGLQNTNGYTALMRAVDINIWVVAEETSLENIKETVLTILTTIPINEQQRIRNSMAGLISIRYSQPILPRDVRKLISRRVVNDFVEEQMHRIKKYLAMQNKFNLTAREVALSTAGLTPSTNKIYTSIAQLLDLENPQSYNLIRNRVKQNIERIIAYGKPLLGTIQADPQVTTYEDIDKLLGTFDQPK